MSGGMSLSDYIPWESLGGSGRKGVDDIPEKRISVPFHFPVGRYPDRIPVFVAERLSEKVLDYSFGGIRIMEFPDAVEG